MGRRPQLQRELFNDWGAYIECFGETDDIYYIGYVSGGVSECCVIEKSDPDTLYALQYDYWIKGVSLDNKPVYKRTGDPPMQPEPGKLSWLGLKKLIYELGDSFGECCDEILSEENKVGFTDNDGCWWTINSEVIYYYLVSGSDDSVTIAFSYYNKEEYLNGILYEMTPYEERQKLERPKDPDTRFYAVTFAKDGNGDWHRTDITPYEPEG